MGHDETSRLVWTSDPTHDYVYVAQEVGFEDSTILGIRRTVEQAKALCLEDSRRGTDEEPLFLAWSDHQEGTYEHLASTGQHYSYRYAILRYDLTVPVIPRGAP